MKQNEKDYATVQIRRVIKDQLVEYCNKRGLKIGRFVEKIFTSHMSGSNTATTGSFTL